LFAFKVLLKQICMHLRCSIFTLILVGTVQYVNLFLRAVV